MQTGLRWLNKQYKDTHLKFHHKSVARSCQNYWGLHRNYDVMTSILKSSKFIKYQISGKWSHYSLCIFKVDISGYNMGAPNRLLASLLIHLPGCYICLKLYEKNGKALDILVWPCYTFLSLCWGKRYFKKVVLSRIFPQQLRILCLLT